MSVRNENTTVFLLKRAGHWYGWFDNFSGDGDFLLQVKVTHCRIFPSHELVILHSWAVLSQLLYFTWPAWKKDCLLTFLQFYSIHRDIKCSCHKPHAKIATFFESKIISNLKIAVQRLLDFCGRGQLLEWILQQTRGINCYCKGISLARFRISRNCPSVPSSTIRLDGSDKAF